MKTGFLSAACLFVSAALAFAADSSPTLRFDNTTYVLAKVTVSPDGTVTNDYIKQGESIEKHTTLLTIQHAPKVGSINEAINPWLQSVRTQLTRKWSATKTPNSSLDADVVVEAWVASPTDPRTDVTLQRFVSESDIEGVKTYRFIDKVDPSAPGAKEEFMAKKSVRMNQLAELKVQPVLKLEAPVSGAKAYADSVRP
jgi:hypothetical protein